MLLKVYAYPAIYNWMKTKVGLFNSTAELKEIVSKFSANEVIEVDGDNFKVIRNSSGDISLEGFDSKDRQEVINTLTCHFEEKIAC